MTRDIEPRIGRLEEAAIGGERVQIRPLTDAPAHLRQAHSFVQATAPGRVILWLDAADGRA